MSFQDQHTKDTIKYTTCGYHCNCECVVKVRTRNGMIVSCEPDDTVNPGVPREDGYLPDEVIDTGMVQTRACAKGYAQTLTLQDPDRLRYPMKRLGKRGEARFERISWEEALDTVARKLVEMKQAHGPYSILHEPYSNYSKCSFPLAPWFGAGVAGWYAHSSNGWQEPQLWVLGKEHTVGEGNDLEQDEANVFRSRLIVLWGLNPLVTFNGGWAYNLLRAKERGIPIICVESRYTPTVEVLADQWIPIRPTTDVALMIAMANVWFREDLCDREFVEKHVEPGGLALWKAYVLGDSDGIEKTPEWAAGICGVPAETIREFARLYARSKPVNLNVSVSIGRQFYGENPARASMYLQALTGNTCIPGGTAAARTGLFRGRMTLPVPKVDWQRRPGTYKPLVLMCGYKWLKAVDLREKLDKGQMSREAYNNAIGNSPGNPCPNIKMAIIESNCNHPSSLPDINGNIRALKKLEFYVAFSHYAGTAAARYADILLPQMATAYEGRDCVCAAGSTDLFKSGRHLANYFLYRQKCVEPPGEIKSGDWFWVQIARRLGLAGLFSPRLAETPDDQWDDTIELLHKEAYEGWAAREEIAVLNPPHWEEFQKKPVFRYPIKEPSHPFKSAVKSGLNPFRGTPSGKIEFHSEKLARGPGFLAANEFSPGKCYGGGNLPPVAQMTVGGKDNFYSQDSVKYPLLMSTPHAAHRVLSFLDNNQWLKEHYRHALWMSVTDARARGIADNDRLRVFNDLGELIVPAYVTSRIVPGTVCLFNGAWYQPGEARTELMPDGIDTGGAPNFLTHNEDLPSTIVGFLPCKGLVQVEKWRDPLSSQGRIPVEPARISHAGGPGGPGK
ncbi:MAG: molybdopterin-dependent oxidoreductase [Chloroflexi bacterium]|nr:molybdopterin-dependent oxidoreductase [Chloroflexota bacterium]